MTMVQMHRRLSSLEKRLLALQKALDYQHAVDGIRRGLESADRDEGQPARKVFAALRRKHRVARGR